MSVRGVSGGGPGERDRSPVWGVLNRKLSLNSPHTVCGYRRASRLSRIGVADARGWRTGRSGRHCDGKSVCCEQKTLKTMRIHIGD